MSANVLFVVMILFSSIALLIAFIAATIAASDLQGSPSYSTNSNIIDAHKYLTIAAVLGGSALSILIIIMIVAAFTGGFNSTTISEDFLNTKFITPSDLNKAYEAEVELSSGHSTQLLIIAFLIIIGIITLIIGILSIIGAVILANLSYGDSKTNSAYSASIVASVAGVGGIGLIIVAVITYITIRNNKTKMLDELEDFTIRGENDKLNKQKSVLLQPTQNKVLLQPVRNNNIHHKYHNKQHNYKSQQSINDNVVLVPTSKKQQSIKDNVELDPTTNNDNVELDPTTNNNNVELQQKTNNDNVELDPTPIQNPKQQPIQIKQQPNNIRIPPKTQQNQTF